MNLDISKKIQKFDYLVLLPIVGLAFYIAFIPHQHYPYPVHIDEWIHMAYANAILQAGSVTHVEPFFGASTVGLGSNLEAGFHIFWGVFQRISGLSWLTIFRYFPGVMFMITILSAYILAHREGFGWEAALFTCLIITTIGILGPAFLVPVAMGLPFSLLVIFLAFNFRSAWSYFALFIFYCFLLAMHPPSAILLAIILMPYILLNLRGELRHSLSITLALALPLLVVFIRYQGLALSSIRQMVSQSPPLDYVDIPKIMQDYGYIPVAFAILGVFLLTIKGGKKNLSLVLGLLALTLMQAAFFTLGYGIQIMYTRGLMYMMLMLSVVGGVGLMGLARWGIPKLIGLRFKSPPVNLIVSIFLSVVLVGVILETAIPERLNTPYYHMISTQDYEAFVWIRDNIGENYKKAILDPWKATAFTAITGKYIYTRIHIARENKDDIAYKFLDNGCTDTSFLREAKISIVYTSSGCNNPDLEEVRENVFLLKQAGTK